MASTLPLVTWRRVPFCSCSLSRTCSALEGQFNSQRWLYVQQPYSLLRLAAPRPRYKCARPVQVKVRAEKGPWMNFWIPEANEGRLKNGTGQATDQNVLMKLLIAAVLVAAVFTIFAALQSQASFEAIGTKVVDVGPQYKLTLFGREILIGERSPGWVYFWLLMAAGFGLFVSEEALNVWVGAVLARTLTFDRLWMDFVTSVSRNGLYIFSTLFWVYWGVCISDMIPFYAGRFAAQTKTGDTLRKKVGVSEEKLTIIEEMVQRYGNLIGFIERFSLGVRNPTSFVAGAMGVPPEKFFTGVCLGALITMPLQMGVGCAFREHPVKALVAVAAAVAGWTVLPYVAAGLASIYFVIWNKVGNQHDKRSTTLSSTSD